MANHNCVECHKRFSRVYECKDPVKKRLQNKIYMRKWREKNREHYRFLMRKAQKKYHKRHFTPMDPAKKRKSLSNSQKAKWDNYTTEQYERHCAAIREGHHRRRQAQV